MSLSVFQKSEFVSVSYKYLRLNCNKERDTSNIKKKLSFLCTKKILEPSIIFSPNNVLRKFLTELLTFACIFYLQASYSFNFSIILIKSIIKWFILQILWKFVFVKFITLKCVYVSAAKKFTVLNQWDPRRLTDSTFKWL